MTQHRDVNLLVLQAGGPTAVLNSTLYGVIDESLRHAGPIARVIGARDGMHGLVRGELLDLSTIAKTDLGLLRSTPGATLGSSRYKATDDDLPRVIGQFRRPGVRWLLMIGGNGHMRAA